MNHLLCYTWLCMCAKESPLSAKMSISKYFSYNCQKLESAKKELFTSYSAIIKEIESRNVSFVNESDEIDTSKEKDAFLSRNGNIYDEFSLHEMIHNDLDKLYDNIKESFLKINKIYYEIKFYDFVIAEFFQLITISSIESEYKNQDIRASVEKMINMYNKFISLFEKRTFIMSSYALTPFDDDFFTESDFAKQFIIHSKEIYSQLNETIKEAKEIKLGNNHYTHRYEQSFNNQMIKYETEFERLHNLPNNFLIAYKYSFWFNQILMSAKKSFNEVKELLKNDTKISNEDELKVETKLEILKTFAKYSLISYLYKLSTENIEKSNEYKKSLFYEDIKELIIENKMLFRNKDLLNELNWLKNFIKDYRVKNLCPYLLSMITF